MEEENQVQPEPQQLTIKELQRVTTKDPKKVEAGKRLAAINHKKREAKKREEQAHLERIGVNQYYGFGTNLALGVIGGLGFIKARKKSNLQTRNKMIPLRLTSLIWIKSFLYYKDGQEEYSK